MDNEKIIVCISSYYKGGDFIEEIKKLGNHVILITSESLKGDPWPWESIDQVFYMPETKPSIWNLDHLIKGFAHLLTTVRIDAIVALDDFDVEKAALLRESFRIPGMGQTTYRYFRDKLAMRQHAKDKKITVPEFTGIFNNDEVNEFADRVPAPWVLKPRAEASASGIKKIDSKEELWNAIHGLGDERHLFLLESFKPGDVYHVDSLVYKGRVRFTSCSKYLASPMKVSHEGGVFRTKILGKDDPDFKALVEANDNLLTKFGMINGGTHTEFIKGEDGKFYFLETSARIGGAHIHDLIEASTGVNIWREWARIEHALLYNKRYKLKDPDHQYAGLIVSLVKQQHPDTSVFECDEIYKFLPMDYHIGIVYKSDREEKVQQRLDEAAEVITRDFLNILPPTDRPTH